MTLPAMMWSPARTVPPGRAAPRSDRPTAPCPHSRSRPLEPKRDPGRNERAERLSSGAQERQVHGLVGKPGTPVARVISAPSIVPTVRFTLRMVTWPLHRITALDGIGAHGDQLVVQRVSQTVVLFGHAMPRVIDIRHVKDRSQIQPIGLPVVDRVGGVQQFGMADRFLQGPEAQGRQILADLFGDEQEEVHHVIRLAGEPFPQGGFWVAIPTGHVSR